jgi:hypothetical protein
MDSWPEIEFERQGPFRRTLKGGIINPLANYLPGGLLRGLLKFGKSELAAANWADPGGWRSMVISYNGHARKLADRILIKGGTMPMALRNRRRLAGKVLASLIEQSPNQPAYVLCLGAGPGQIIIDAICQSGCTAKALLVDLNADAFEYGKALADAAGLQENISFVQADVRHVNGMLAQPPDIAKMLGICEYLTDEQIIAIAAALAAVMPDGTPIVFNTLSLAHGTDRFFRRVFGLHMIHRDARQLGALFEQAGFGDFTTAGEPLGVYEIVVGRKRPTQTSPPAAARRPPHAEGVAP